MAIEKKKLDTLSQPKSFIYTEQMSDIIDMVEQLNEVDTTVCLSQLTDIH